MRQLSAAAEALEADPLTLTARAAGGDGWTRSEHLLCLVLDELRIANWQRSKDGSKNRNRPKSMSPLRRDPGKRIGKTDRSPGEVAAYLKRLRATPQPTPTDGGET